MVLDSFAFLLAPPSLPLTFGNSAQCSSVGFCICFHQLLDENAMMTFKRVINVITGQVQFRYLLHNCLESYLLPFLWIPGNFSSTRFLTNPITAPSIKRPLLLLSVSVLDPSKSSCSLKFFYPLPYLVPSFIK